MLSEKLPYVFVLLCLVAGTFYQPMQAQGPLRLYGTVAASKPQSSKATPPKLSVVGQATNARVYSSDLLPLIGIDYIRLFGLYGSNVEVILPNQEIPVSAPVRVPIVLRCSSTMNGSKSVKGWIQFNYRCEIIDLVGVNEQNLGDDLCTATLPFAIDVGAQDTVWVDGVSKLTGITSTALTASRTAGIADKGRTVVTITNGELRQTGHCVTDGNTRLVFSNVNLGVYPQPATNRVTVTMNSRSTHQGFIGCYDIHGNEMSRIDISRKSPGESRIEFDVSELINGTYTLQYMHDSGISVVPVVVQR